MRRFLFVATILAGIGGWHGEARVCGAAESPADRAAWWVEHFGVVEDGERAAAVREVFSRVLRASDVRAHRRPRLVILQRAGQSLSVALPDGTVVLSSELVERCFRAPGVCGRSRLAFVLGHELAHLANDDPWPAAAFAAIDDAGLSGLQPLAGLFMAHARSPAGALQELRADQQGLVTMALAGYRPDEILTPSFLDMWREMGRGDGGPHPDAATRADFLRVELGQVMSLLECHRMGVRLYQTGRLRDSLLLLEEFAQRYPSGQTLNTVGLAHYRMAERALAACDPEAVSDFHPAPVLCAELDLGPPVATRSGRGGGCRADPGYRRSLDAAVAAFAAAADRLADPRPAILNLAMTRLLDDRPETVLGLVGEVDLEEGPLREAAVNLKAVALFWWGEQEGLDATERALALLESVAHPEPPTDFNIARICEARGREQAARLHFERFLQGGGSGPRAAHAARLAPAGLSPQSPPSFRLAPWVPLGRLSEVVRREMTSPPFVAHSLGGIDGMVVAGGNRRALVLGDVVEMVEQDPPDVWSFDRWVAACGRPRACHTDLNGTRTCVWDRHAVDFRDGVGVSLVVFGG